MAVLGSAPAGAPAGKSGTPVRHYSTARVVTVWAAAAVPMALLAWVVAPAPPVTAVTGGGATGQRWFTTLLVALAGGLVWQLVFMVIIVGWEQRSLRWAALRQALRLVPPSDAAGRRGGWLWPWLIPAVLCLAAIDILPAGIPALVDRNLGEFVVSIQGWGKT